MCLLVYAFGKFVTIFVLQIMETIKKLSRLAREIKSYILNRFDVLAVVS